MSARPAPVPGLLARQWQDFARLIPACAPEHVRREFHKCFMCGAVAMLDILSAELDPGEDEAGRDEAVLDALRIELEAFMREAMTAASPGGQA